MRLIVIRTYKYRLNANKEVISKLNNWLELCRQLYNVALEQRRSLYRQNCYSITCFKQINQLVGLRAEFPEYKDINSQVLVRVIQKLDMAYGKFFKSISDKDAKLKFPRFKSKNRFNSFMMTQTGWKLDGKYLTIKHIGRMKIRLSRIIEGKIKNVIITKDTMGKWYVCFACEGVNSKQIGKTNKCIGLDIGIKTFINDSDGNKIENPKYFKKSEKLLRIRNRRLFRRKKGSCGRNKARLLFAKTHEKVTNQRNDFLHKMANYYVSNYDTIYVEDVNINGIMRNKIFSKSIKDIAWARFLKYLNYKVEDTGKTVFQIPRFEPTSKTCSQCGAVNEQLTLNDRQWVCKNCGALHDRDYNAAKNILRVGQTLQASTCGTSQSVACESPEVINGECQGFASSFNKGGS
jgi:putative transposase